MSLIVKMSGPGCFSTQAEYNLLGAIVKQQTVGNTMNDQKVVLSLSHVFKGEIVDCSLSHYRSLNHQCNW